MKVNVMILCAAGALLSACGRGLEKQAANEFCECYFGIAKAKNEIATADNAVDMIAPMTELKELDSQAEVCHKRWSKKYDGKIDKRVFKEAVYEEDQSVYKMAEELNLL